MKKGTVIIIAVIIFLIILVYFFYPECAFHRIGSTFEGQNIGEVCHCNIKDSYCTQESANVGEINDTQKEQIGGLFSGK